MTNATLERALALISDLENGPPRKGERTELAIWQILQAAGYPVSVWKPGMDEGVDMTFTGQLDGRVERVGVTVKSARGPISGQAVYRDIGIANRLALDRMLVIALGGASSLARGRADTEHLGKIDLLTLADLRNWLHRHAASGLPPLRGVQLVLRQAMRDVARRLASAPQEIFDVEWRDMERLLREVFDTLGFDTVLTRSAKDGGFDLRLTDELAAVYLVEVKHWESPVGSGPVRKLIEVTAREAAVGGLLLATSGFTPSIFDGLVEFKPTIRLGDGTKIVSLCQAFFRMDTQLWQPDQPLAELLFEDTQALAAPNREAEV